MLEVEVFEWPQFDATNRAVFEEFAQQSNSAQGYHFNEVTLRGHCDSSDVTEAAVGPDSARAVAEQKERIGAWRLQGGWVATCAFGEFP